MLPWTVTAALIASACTQRAPANTALPYDAGDAGAAVDVQVEVDAGPEQKQPLYSYGPELVTLDSPAYKGSSAKTRRFEMGYKDAKLVSVDVADRREGETEWTAAWRRAQTYDQHGRLAEVVELEYLADAGTYVDWSRGNYTYDADHRLERVVIRVAEQKDADCDDGATACARRWRKHSTVTWERDSAAKTVTAVNLVHYDAGDVALEKLEYTFDDKGRIAQEMLWWAWVDSRGNGDKKLRQFRRRTHTYDDTANTLTILGEGTDGKTWAPAARETYQFDADGRLTQSVLERFYGVGGGKWHGDTRGTNTYDTTGKLVTRKVETKGTDMPWRTSYVATVKHTTAADSLGFEAYPPSDWDQWTPATWALRTYYGALGFLAAP